MARLIPSSQFERMSVTTIRLTTNANSALNVIANTSVDSQFSPHRVNSFFKSPNPAVEFGSRVGSSPVALDYFGRALAAKLLRERANYGVNGPN